MVHPAWVDIRFSGTGPFTKYNRSTSQCLLEVADTLCNSGPHLVKVKPYVDGSATSRPIDPDEWGCKRNLYGNCYVQWQDQDVCALIGTEELHFAFFYLSDSHVAALADQFEKHLNDRLKGRSYELVLNGPPQVNHGGCIVLFPDPSCELVSVLMRAVFSWLAELNPAVLAPMSLEKQPMHMVLHPPNHWRAFVKPDSGFEEQCLMLRAQQWFRYWNINLLD